MTQQQDLNVRRLLQLFGMARRAGKVAQGFDAAAGALIKGEAAEVFMAGDCAPRTQRNITRIAEEAGAKVLPVSCTRAELGHAIGCAPTGVLALTDCNFAKKARTLVPAVPEPNKEENVYDD